MNRFNKQILIHNIQKDIKEVLQGYLFEYNDVSTRLNIKLQLEKIIGCQLQDTSDGFIFTYRFDPSTQTHNLNLI